MMSKNEFYIEFEKDEIVKFDHVQALDRFGVLYNEMREASRLTCLGETAKFNLNFLFADVLECLNLLTFNNLSRVIGIANAGRIWHDVKTKRE